MLHVTTEIGKPGKKERERRHFPDSHNQPGEIPPSKPRGRRYIPHNTGKEDEWVPHNQNIGIEYSETGPDWSSRLRYIPDPENPKYPAAEIWPNNWHSMRPYPFTYRRTKNEWLLDPDLTKIGMKCVFDGIHKATDTSEEEITHKMLFGRGRNVNDIDLRNTLPEASPGDKSYQVPEYSPSFHQQEPNSPRPRFGAPNSPYSPRKRESQVDTFIPLVPLPKDKRETFRQKSESRQRQEDIEEVKKLDSWQPAKPISTTIPVIDPNELKRSYHYHTTIDACSLLAINGMIMSGTIDLPQSYLQQSISDYMDISPAIHLISQSALSSQLSIFTTDGILDCQYSTRIV